MHYISPAQTQNHDSLKQGLLLSLGFHLILLIYFWQFTVNLDYKNPEPIKITLKEIKEPFKTKKQIITPPDIKPSKVEPKETNKLSDKNFIVEKEQIKRGIDPNAGPIVSGKNKPAASQGQQTKQKKEASKQANKTSEEKVKKVDKQIKTLSLDANTLFKKYTKTEQEAHRNKQENQLSGYRAFSRPQGSGAAFMGQAGVSDFIPNLPDGDITLLNAKADKFAVFVRRVATRVFGALRTVGWEQVRALDIKTIREYSTVRAVLDSKGKLIDIRLEGNSGSHRFDKVLMQAANKGAQDPNPPPDAVASDGNYHFIFKSKSWVTIYPGRRGAPVERRWLLLATGLL